MLLCRLLCCKVAMLLLTQIVSTTMHDDEKLHAAVSQPSLGHMGPNFEG